MRLLYASLLCCCLASYVVFAQRQADTQNHPDSDNLNLIELLRFAIRAKYDSTNFSLAILTGNQAGFYEEKKLFYQLNLDKAIASRLQPKGQTAHPPLPGREEEFAQNIENAEMLLAANQYKLAEKQLLHAQKLLENPKKNEEIAPMPHLVARLYNTMGLLYTSLGEYNQAESYFTKTLQYIEQSFPQGGSFFYWATLHNLAVLRFHQARYPEAIQLIEQVYPKLVRPKIHLPQAIALNNHAYMLYALGNYKNAEENYKQALSIAEKNISKKNFNYQRILINLALLYQEAGQLSQARQVYEKALRIAKKRFKSNSPDYAHLLTRYASLMEQEQNYKQARELCEQALRIYQKKFGTLHPSYATTLEQLAHIDLAEQQGEQALTKLHQALDIRLQTQGEQHPDYAQTLQWLAVGYWQQQQIVQAKYFFSQSIQKNQGFIASFFSSMSDTERSRYWQRMQPSYQLFFHFVASQPTDDSLIKAAYEVWVSVRGILLQTSASIRQRVISSADKTLIELFEAWRHQRERLAYYYTLSKEELQQQAIDLPQEEQEALQLERQLSTRSQAFAHMQAQQITYEQLVQQLETGSALLDIMRLSSFTYPTPLHADYYAWLLLPKQTRPLLVKLGEAERFEKRDLVYYQNNIKLKREDTRSFQAFFFTIDSLLASKRIKKLYFCNDGAYHQVNLLGLYNADKETYVGDMYQLVQLAHPKELLRSPASVEHIHHALLVGYPSYGTDAVSPLPGTLKEVLNIEGILKSFRIHAYTLLQEDASEEKLKQMLHQQNIHLLHIATHGFFLSDAGKLNNSEAPFWQRSMIFGIQAEKASQNPLLRAGLLLSNCAQALRQESIPLPADAQNNGILTAFEVTTLPLQHTHMVVLSACETALGEVQIGEGVYGFQKAFQEAGVPLIVMSLWRVDDQATQLLFSHFYRLLLQLKKPREAFQLAQAEVRKQYPHPYYWAAFVMTGQ